MDDEPPEQDYQRDYFESLIRKYQCRNTQFTQRQCDIRQRLEAIERSLPAIMCFNMLQPKNENHPPTIELDSSPVKEESSKNIQKEQNFKNVRDERNMRSCNCPVCPLDPDYETKSKSNNIPSKLINIRADMNMRNCLCNPCPIDKDILFATEANVVETNIITTTDKIDVPANKTPYQSMISTDDARYLSKIKELAKNEQKLKEDIEELEHREQAYSKVMKQPSDWFEKDSSCTGAGDFEVNALRRINQELEDNNKMLADELTEVKNEIKHIQETIEEPMRRELENEKCKCLNLEEKVYKRATDITMKQSAQQRQMNLLQKQVQSAKQNLNDLHIVNKRLKEELCMLNCRCNELQTDLINQKISEVHTISRLTATLYKETYQPPFGKPNFPANGGDTDGNGSSDDLNNIARNLSKLIQDATSCKNCKDTHNDMIDTVQYIKKLVDIVNSDKKDSRVAESTSEIFCKCVDWKKLREEMQVEESTYEILSPKPVYPKESAPSTDIDTGPATTPVAEIEVEQMLEQWAEQRVDQPKRKSAVETAEHITEIVLQRIASEKPELKQKLTPIQLTTKPESKIKEDISQTDIELGSESITDATLTTSPMEQLVTESSEPPTNDTEEDAGDTTTDVDEEDNIIQSIEETEVTVESREQLLQEAQIPESTESEEKIKGFEDKVVERIEIVPAHDSTVIRGESEMLERARDSTGIQYTQEETQETKVVEPIELPTESNKDDEITTNLSASEIENITDPNVILQVKESILAEEVPKAVSTDSSKDKVHTDENLIALDMENIIRSSIVFKENDDIPTENTPKEVRDESETEEGIEIAEEKLLLEGTVSGSTTRHTEDTEAQYEKSSDTAKIISTAEVDKQEITTSFALEQNESAPTEGEDVAILEQAEMEHVPEVDAHQEADMVTESEDITPPEKEAVIEETAEQNPDQEEPMHRESTELTPQEQESIIEQTDTFAVEQQQSVPTEPKTIPLQEQAISYKEDEKGDYVESVEPVEKSTLAADIIKTICRCIPRAQPALCDCLETEKRATKISSTASLDLHIKQMLQDVMDGHIHEQDKARSTESTEKFIGEIVEKISLTRQKSTSKESSRKSLHSKEASKKSLPPEETLVQQKLDSKEPSKESMQSKESSKKSLPQSEIDVAIKASSRSGESASKTSSKKSVEVDLEMKQSASATPVDENKDQDQDHGSALLVQTDIITSEREIVSKPSSETKCEGISKSASKESSGKLITSEGSRKSIKEKSYESFKQSREIVSKPASKEMSVKSLPDKLPSIKEDISAEGDPSERIVADIEAEGNVPIEAEIELISKSSDGVYITTTVTSSGHVEVTTEGPTGVVETTLKVTESGNLEVVTGVTEFDKPSEGDIKEIESDSQKEGPQLEVIHPPIDQIKESQDTLDIEESTKSSDQVYEEPKESVTPERSMEGTKELGEEIKTSSDVPLGVITEEEEEMGKIKEVIIREEEEKMDKIEEVIIREEEEEMDKIKEVTIREEEEKMDKIKEVIIREEEEKMDKRKEVIIRDEEEIDTKDQQPVKEVTPGKICECPPPESVCKCKIESTIEKDGINDDDDEHHKKEFKIEEKVNDQKEEIGHQRDSKVQQNEFIEEVSSTQEAMTNNQEDLEDPRKDHANTTPCKCKEGDRESETSKNEVENEFSAEEPGKETSEKEEGPSVILCKCQDSEIPPGHDEDQTDDLKKQSEDFKDFKQVIDGKALEIQDGNEEKTALNINRSKHSTSQVNLEPIRSVVIVTEIPAEHICHDDYENSDSYSSGSSETNVSILEDLQPVTLEPLKETSTITLQSSRIKGFSTIETTIEYKTHEQVPHFSKPLEQMKEEKTSKSILKYTGSNWSSEQPEVGSRSTESLRRVKLEQLNSKQPEGIAVKTSTTDLTFSTCVCEEKILPNKTNETADTKEASTQRRPSHDDNKYSSSFGPGATAVNNLKIIICNRDSCKTYPTKEESIDSIPSLPICNCVKNIQQQIPKICNAKSCTAGTTNQGENNRLKTKYSDNTLAHKRAPKNKGGKHSSDNKLSVENATCTTCDKTSCQVIKSGSHYTSMDSISNDEDLYICPDTCRNVGVQSSPKLQKTKTEFVCPKSCDDMRVQEKFTSFKEKTTKSYSRGVCADQPTIPENKAGFASKEIQQSMPIQRKHHSTNTPRSSKICNVDLCDSARSAQRTVSTYYSCNPVEVAAPKKASPLKLQTLACDPNECKKKSKSTTEPRVSITDPKICDRRTCKKDIATNYESSRLQDKKKTEYKPCTCKQELVSSIPKLKKSESVLKTACTSLTCSGVQVDLVKKPVSQTSNQCPSATCSATKYFTPASGTSKHSGNKSETTCTAATCIGEIAQHPGKDQLGDLNISTKETIEIAETISVTDDQKAVDHFLAICPENVDENKMEKSDTVLEIQRSKSSKIKFSDISEEQTDNKIPSEQNIQSSTSISDTIEGKESDEKTKISTSSTKVPSIASIEEIKLKAIETDTGLTTDSCSKLQLQNEDKKIDAIHSVENDILQDKAEILKQTSSAMKQLSVIKSESVTKEESVTRKPSTMQEKSLAKIPSAMKQPSLAKVQSVTKQLSIAKEPSITEIQSITKEQSITEKQSITEEQSIPEEQNVTEEQSITMGTSDTRESSTIKKLSSMSITKKPSATTEVTRDQSETKEINVVTQPSIIKKLSSMSIRKKPSVTTDQSVTEEINVVTQPSIIKKLSSMSIRKKPSVTTDQSVTEEINVVTQPSIIKKLSSMSIRKKPSVTTEVTRDQSVTEEINVVTQPSIIKEPSISQQSKEEIQERTVAEKQASYLATHSEDKVLQSDRSKIPKLSSGNLTKPKSASRYTLTEKETSIIDYNRDERVVYQSKDEVIDEDTKKATAIFEESSRSHKSVSHSSKNAIIIEEEKEKLSKRGTESKISQKSSGSMRGSEHQDQSQTKQIERVSQQSSKMGTASTSTHKSAGENASAEINAKVTTNEKQLPSSRKDDDKQSTKPSSEESICLPCGRIYERASGDKMARQHKEPPDKESKGSITTTDSEKKSMSKIPVLVTKASSILKEKHQGDCACVECLTEETQKTGHLPDCDCVDCLCHPKKFEQTLPTVLEPEHSQESDLKQHSPSCTCIDCLCNPTVTPHKPLTDQKLYRKAKHSPSCDCIDCLCSPTITERKLITGVTSTVVCSAIEPVKSKHHPACKCPVCSCDPCGHQPQCSCVLCKCDPCKDVIREFKKHPPDCTCPDCICAPCGDKTVEERKHTRYCSCRDCTCDPCCVKKVEEQKHPEDCSCPDCVCAPCFDENIEKQKHPANCTCPDCVCAPCFDKNIEERKHPPDCNCADCICDPCTDSKVQNKKEHPKDCKCPDCSFLSSNNEKDQKDELPQTHIEDGDCTCNECVCDPCDDPKVASKRDKCQKCGCIVCICDPCEDPKVVTDRTPHPPFCNCPKCFCDPCQDSTKSQAHGPDCRCKRCICSPCKADIKHGPNCDCPVCSCDPCTDLQPTTDPDKKPSIHGFDCICEKCKPAIVKEPQHSKNCRCSICKRGDQQKPKTISPNIKHSKKCKCSTCTQNKIKADAERRQENVRVSTREVDLPEIPEECPNCDCSPICICDDCPAMKNNTAPVAKNMKNETLKKNIQNIEQENVQREKDIKELEGLVEQIRCACKDAEEQASRTSPPEPTCIQKASSFKNTLSGLEIAMDTLQKKCKMKDKMIDAMTQELRLRANSHIFQEMLKNIAGLSSTNVDFDRTEICDSLPRPMNDSKYGRTSYRYVEDASVCICKQDSVNMKIINVKPISPNSILIKWSQPANSEVIGYEVVINNVLKSRIRSAQRTSAVIFAVDVKNKINISIFAITQLGRCQPPATCIYG